LVYCSVRIIWNWLNQHLMPNKFTCQGATIGHKWVDQIICYDQPRSLVNPLSGNAP
jgi:hypothetical protein